MDSDFFGGDSFRRVRLGAADQVLGDLRARILSGGYPKGKRLPSEKELATHYEVSSPTVREAIRALSAMSLVEVRHGSGTFVVADSSTLMASAMTAVVELENIDLQSILEVTETFYGQAVGLAVEVAGQNEIDALRAVALGFESARDAEDFAEKLRSFLTLLVSLSHNGLLVALSTYLIDIQISQAREAAKANPSVWEQVAGGLMAERIAIVDALDARDGVRAMGAVHSYSVRGRELVGRFASASTSAGRQTSLSSPGIPHAGSPSPRG